MLSSAAEGAAEDSQRASFLQAPELVETPRYMEVSIINPLSMGGPFSIAMLNYRRVNNYIIMYWFMSIMIVIN